MTVRNTNADEVSRLLPPPDSEGSSETLDETEERGERDANAANQSVGTLRAVLITLSLWVLIFLQAANMSGLTTTQGAIASDLDAYAKATWFTSTYLIAVSSIAPLAGRFTQIFSARNCIFVSSVIFVIGLLITSQAPSFAIFLVGRAISGIGAAGVLTISIILVLELTGKKRRGLFVGLVNTGFTSGVALGAVVAGALLPVTGWRALFWMQTPFIFSAGTALFFSIPRSFVSGPQGSEKETIRQKLAKIDYIGAVTLTSSIILFLYGLASAEIQWIPILVSPLILTIFISNEIYLTDNPIIPVSVLKSRGALLTCLAQLGFMASRWLVLFYTPVYASALRGWAPAAAGTILIPTNFGFAVGGLLVGWLHVRRAGSFYFSCTLSFALFSGTLFILSQLSTPNSSMTVFISVCFLNGLATGAALNYTLAHLLHLSLSDTYFIVTALLATFRGFAGSFGSAIGGGHFARLLQTSLVQGFADKGLSGKEELIRQLLGSPALVQGLRGADQEVAIASYTAALQGLFLAGSGLSLIMVFIQASTGWEAPVEKVDETLDTQDQEIDEHISG